MKNNHTTRIKDLPGTERPYEKCMRFGPGALSDAELLCVLLRTGAEGVSALDMSRSLLSSLGPNALSKLHRVSLQDLEQIRGIGKVKALQIRCLAELSMRIAQSQIGMADELNYNDPDTIGSYYMEEMRHECQEIVLLLCLSSKGRLLSKKVISRGDVRSAILSPREIYAEALSQRAAAVILLHNHPSGDPTPSREDILVTRQILEAGRLIGIELLDHLVIGDRNYVSLRQAGLMKKNAS